MSDNENQPVVDVDVARSRTRSFLNRHKPKLVATGIAALAATSFVLGRKSTNVDVDVDYNPPTDNTQD